MRTVTAKTAKDIALAGIKVEFYERDNAIQSVTLTDANGGFCKFGMGQYSNFVVEVAAPPKTEKKWVLAGSVVGVEVRHVFETKWDAEAHEQQYKSKVYNADDCQLTVTEQEILVGE